MNLIRQIPSLELQTIAFLDKVLGGNTPSSIRLDWNGFQTLLSYEPEYFLTSSMPRRPVLVISDVQVPVRFRGRGWLTRYWEMCWFCSGLGIIIEPVRYEPLGNSLLRAGFQQLDGSPSTYYLKSIA